VNFYKTEKDATKRAQEVKAMMTNPEQWTAKVWENLGWHWELKAGAVQLHETFYPDERSYGFWCLMSRQIDGFGGNPDWTLRASRFDDPNDAVEAQVKFARKHLDQLTASVEHGETLSRRTPCPDSTCVGRKASSGRPEFGSGCNER